ncbi:hypothetical protein LMG19282_04231 [Cupriavidus campinensis]|jgi:uncharacterized protein YdaU (DUF1376 family)|uniref:YdaU family protein n=1 Tax=Cupriavidus campinensis TaxID=151783 RepID=A0AAE9HY83_9BURK|nr:MULTISPECIES: YdaU family protein [Cupriavidus]URF02993.1 YdaU family protein [Cupriavidus campinensis]CAG2152608.1 hypothetical protein LMG19282_04231 [Cupriavidus campinensis]
MNYYERHIGDYIRDTVGLSMLEDGAYSRLLDQLYQTEKPLPLDRKEVYRMARATSPAERKAVDYVVGKFFEKGDDGFIQKRAMEILAEYWDRPEQPEKKNSKEGNRERQRKSRERRKAMFEVLAGHGIVPRYDTPMRELEAMLSRVTSQPVTPENCDMSQPVTESVMAPVMGNHSPPPTNHYPDNTLTTADAVVVDSDTAADLVLEPDTGKPRKPGRPDCPHQAIVALYHELLPMCPSIRDWTPARAQALRARWNEDPKRQTLDYWRKLFAYIAESDFLTGRTRPQPGRKPFVASLEWIVKAENFTKIREERYHEQVTA